MKEFQFEPITREQIRDYAEASGDRNRIHLDEAFAKEAGLPSVIAHGMLGMGLMGRALFDWGYNPVNFARFSVKFKAMVFPGDQLCAKLSDASNSELRFFLVNQRNEEVLSGNVRLKEES